MSDDVTKKKVFTFDHDELGLLREEMTQLHEDNKEMELKVVGVGVLVTLDIVLNLIRIVLALC